MNPIDALPEFHADRLRAFLAVVRAKGFSRGARALGQSQSSVSQAVLGLERELGEPLFVRDGRTIHLTEAGAVLQRHAERAFAELAAARIELGRRKELRAGFLSLGASDTLATYFLPPLLMAFRAKHPQIELRLHNRPSPAVAARVASRRLDLGMISLPLPDRLRLGGRVPSDVLRLTVLAEQREVVICAPGHALAKRKRIDIAELVRHPLILLDATTSTRSFLEAQFRAGEHEPKVVMETSSVEVAKRFVGLDFGVSVIPAMAVAREVAQRELVSLALSVAAPAREVALITSTLGPLSHATRAFLTIAQSALPAAASRARGSP